MSCCDASEVDWLEARIAKTEELIEAIEDAILALTGGAQSYTLNTGQTTQSVTKASLGSLRLQLDSLENRRAVLKQRLCGNGTTHVVPGF